MDDRKRQINEFEQRKKELASLLETLRAQIGQSVFEHYENSRETVDLSADSGLFGELNACGRHRDDIADWEEAIRAAERQMLLFKELGQNIEDKEAQCGTCRNELAELHRELGKMLLEGSGTEEFCSPFRTEADELSGKIRSLEERVSDLENKERGNVFTWIGKSAQGLVLRSFLVKAQDGLDRLHRTAGEKFGREASASLFPETADIDGLCARIDAKREAALTIGRELADLKEEKNGIAETFSVDGGPARHIQTLKTRILDSQAELKRLFAGIGRQVSGTPGGKSGIAGLLTAEDGERVAEAEKAVRGIRECEAAAEKLKAAIAIDEENAGIEKYRRMIQEKRDKIARAEKDILELEKSIRDSEAGIEKLRRLS
jgi:uncharacterized coiled-coil DUF342 family protein